MQISKISIVICALAACATLPLRATDTPAQAAARAQVVAKLKELEAMSPETNAPAPVPMKPAPVKVAPVIATPPPATVKMVPIVTNAAAPMTMAPVKMQTPVVMPAPTAGSDIGLKMPTAPALPIPASKEARLQALLAKYQADQISPADYHKQRAAILAEP